MNLEKTPVSILQEMMQQRNIIPHYQLLSEQGSRTHKPTFIVRVFADGITGIGKGNSKKVAKQEAARNFLQRIGAENFIEINQSQEMDSIGSEITVKPKVVYEEPSTSATIVQNFELSSIDLNIRKKAVAVLKYYTMQLNLPNPVYEEISASGPAHQRLFTYKCSIGSFCREASGRTKIEARDTSALLMFEELKKVNFEIPKCEEKSPKSVKDITVQVKTKKNKMDGDNLNVDDKQNENIINNTQKIKNNISTSQDQSAIISSTNYDESTYNKMIDHFYIIKNYMFAKNLTYDELWQAYPGYDLKTLENVMNHLGIKYNLTYLKQDNAFIACLLINVAPAFYIIEIGSTIAEVTKSVAKNMLFLLRASTK